MNNKNTHKRENFDVSPSQQADIEMLQHLVGASTKKDALLMAVKATLLLTTELQKGNQLFVGLPGQDLKRFVMLGIEKPDNRTWMFLVSHEHPWKRQLYVKGRKLQASNVWSDIRANNLTTEEALYNWDLSRPVLNEIIEYCEANQELICMEADEEKRRLREKGVDIDAITPN
jgi:hypothetical protein